MPTGQREGAPVMVKGGILPIAGRMAGGTIGAKPALVFIILFVAGVTVGRRTFVNAILVALFALRFGVLAFQFEGSQVVVEFCGLPAFGGMAGGTVRAEAPIVRIIPAMARETILRG